MTFPADVALARPRAGVVVIELNGEHDLTTKPQLGQLLERLIADNEHVVVDVTQAQFVDSSFVHNLLIADQMASQKGKTFRLQMGTTPVVRRALEISGILDNISVAYNREGAVA